MLIRAWKTCDIRQLICATVSFICSISSGNGRPTSGDYDLWQSPDFPIRDLNQPRMEESWNQQRPLSGPMSTPLGPVSGIEGRTSSSDVNWPSFSLPSQRFLGSIPMLSRFAESPIGDGNLPALSRFSYSSMSDLGGGLPSLSAFSQGPIDDPSASIAGGSPWPPLSYFSERSPGTPDLPSLSAMSANVPTSKGGLPELSAMSENVPTSKGGLPELSGMSKNVPTSDGKPELSAMSRNQQDPASWNAAGPAAGSLALRKLSWDRPASGDIRPPLSPFSSNVPTRNEGPALSPMSEAGRDPASWPALQRGQRGSTASSDYWNRPASADVRPALSSMSADPPTRDETPSLSPMSKAGRDPRTGSWSTAQRAYDWDQSASGAVWPPLSSFSQHSPLEYEKPALSAMSERQLEPSNWISDVGGERTARWDQPASDSVYPPLSSFALGPLYDQSGDGLSRLSQMPMDNKEMVGVHPPLSSLSQSDRERYWHLNFPTSMSLDQTRAKILTIISSLLLTFVLVPRI